MVQSAHRFFVDALYKFILTPSLKQVAAAYRHDFVAKTSLESGGHIAVTA